MKDIDDTASEFTYDSSINSFVNPELVLESKQTRFSPQVYYGKIDHYVDVTAKSPSGMGSAQIEIRINTTEDIQANKFVEINSCTSRQFGGAVNFQSWTHGGDDLSINSSRTWINGTVYGTLVIAYTEPKSGMQVTYTSDHAWKIGITPA